MTTAENSIAAGGSPTPRRAQPGSTTDHLLHAASALLQTLSRGPQEADAHARRQAFEAAYRRWLVNHASVAGSPEERMEKVRLVLTAAMAAPDLRRALEIMIRFGKLVTPELSPVAMRERSDTMVLRFDRTRLPGAAGLISDLWPLALLLSQLECLSGQRLGGVQGSVRHRASVPEGAVALLFDQPILFEQDTLALLVPQRHLRCAVIASYAQASTFLPRLMADAFGEGITPNAEFRFILRGILRLDRLGGLGMSTLESVAGRLGCSPATLRRKLAQEGSSFRELRDDVNDELARRWLADERVSIATIAGRLGFSDAYSFARFFTRINGCTPARFRRRHVAAGAMSGNVVFQDGQDIVQPRGDLDKPVKGGCRTEQRTDRGS